MKFFVKLLVKTTSVKLAPYSTMLTSVSYLTDFYRSDLDNFYTI